MNERSKLALCLAGALLCIGAAGALVHTFKGSWRGQDAPTTVAGPALTLNVSSGGERTSDSKRAPSAEDRYAYVTGSVLNPGIYPIPENARVFHLIDAAGGLRSDADSAQINLAAPLKDGAHVHVKALVPDGTKDARPGGSVRNNEKRAEFSEEMGFVYVNSATEDELQKLPGVGPATAKKIIEFRQSHGPLTSADDLLEVSGIGKSKLDRMRSFLRF